MTGKPIYWIAAKHLAALIILEYKFNEYTMKKFVQEP